MERKLVSTVHYLQFTDCAHENIELITGKATKAERGNLCRPTYIPVN